ncbi:MAG TPA: hypothetical protein VJ904_00470 [Tichowtungia sp.]|nr:hypothetical protein [Tichowtungia sp.]
MKKRLAILEELRLWLRGRFTLTNEEKLWLLIVLIILWAGLLGRYFHLKNQTAEPLTDQQVEERLSP